MKNKITIALALALVVLPFGVKAELVPACDGCEVMVEAPVVTEPTQEVPVVVETPVVHHGDDYVPPVATTTPPVIEEPATTTPPVIAEPLAPSAPITPILKASKSGGSRGGQVLGASIQHSNLNQLQALLDAIIRAFNDLQAQSK